MTQIDRRRLLALGVAATALPAAIQRAWAIEAKTVTGTIADVEHVVILMQENRSFDHYFGTMHGVRGFGDRFPAPLPGGKTVWRQGYTKGEPREVAPFVLNTATSPELMRVEGTPHSWHDSQYAWDHGRMTNWPDHKNPHAMAYYTEADLPFQFALANAFTICDAYHCSFQGGTNTNRLFLWSGTNDGAGTRGGPSISNSHDTLPAKQPQAKAPYTWTTYPERLEAAGVSWKIYEDMADNFGDNPLVGFHAFRESLEGRGNPALAAKGLSTQHLDVLLADVKAGTLPSVSWVISPAKDSEHPGPSSPAQGADYIARVLDALTSNPDVWAKTVLLINFDENDGFFDHVPPPAPPSIGPDGKWLGMSTEDTGGEYHRVRADSEKASEREDLMERPYGLGPRVPMSVISPFSRGGFVNSEVFDHTSVIRFLEKRFGVMEPNISAWRRAVCGDLTSCFDFATPNLTAADLPGTRIAAEVAAGFSKRTTPVTPETPAAPVQAAGVRRSRALPYRFDVVDMDGQWLALNMINQSDEVGIVLHAYDLLKPETLPMRFTIGPRNAAIKMWPKEPYDVALYGPNGFYRRYSGSGGDANAPAVRPVLVTRLDEARTMEFGFDVSWKDASDEIVVTPGAYADKLGGRNMRPGPGKTHVMDRLWRLSETGGWYDFVLTRPAQPGWRRRYAGRMENGLPSVSDPAMGGAAVMEWT